MRKMMMLAGSSALLGAMTPAERAKGRYMRDGTGHPDARAPLEMKSWIAGVEDKLKGFGVDATTIKDLKERVDGLEKKAHPFSPSRMRGLGNVGAGAIEGTVGEQFVQAKAAEAASMSRTDRVSLEMKAASITSSTAGVAGSAGDLVVPARDTAVMLPKRRLTIRNLLNVIPVGSGAVEYPRQITRPTAADTVAEAALKPQSDIRYALETAPIRTIAHFVKASRQILDDAPQLGALIDTDLRYGLSIKEEAQLLYGDGNDQNLKGMMLVATAFALADAIENANEIDKIGLAILQASLTDIEPDGIVMHPSVWWKMRLTKDLNGKYLMGDPMQAVAPNLFGLPVIPTQAINQGDFLVGAFAPQTLYERWEAGVELGFVDDDFTRNMVTILGEERVGFAAKQPQALIKGEFADI
ncbi:MAG TPA: phage major capsid protein [Sphingomonas sp.]|nr:phage major capsid protein [Sphingomonas sp.]